MNFEVLHKSTKIDIELRRRYLEAIELLNQIAQDENVPQDLVFKARSLIKEYSDSIRE